MSEMHITELIDLARLPVNDMPPLNHLFPPGPLPATEPEPTYCGIMRTPKVRVTREEGAPVRTCRVCQEKAGWL